MKPVGSSTSRFAAMTLVLEFFVVFFATLVASRLSGLDAAVVWTGGGVLAVACLLASGVVRRPGGLAVGTVLQVLLIGTGLWVPAMFALGAVFAALWVWLLLLGRRIDRDRLSVLSARASRPAGPPEPRS